MADLKFHCPECQQKIAVDSSAAGAKIDCPTCRSTLVVPAASDAPVKLEQRRRLAVFGGAQNDLYSALEQREEKLKDAETQLAQALETVAKLEAGQARLQKELADGAGAARPE